MSPLAYTKNITRKANIVIEQASLAELALIGVSYTLFTVTLIGAIMALSIMRRIRIRRETRQPVMPLYVPFPPQPAAGIYRTGDTDPSTVLFPQARRNVVTRVVLHPRRDTAR